MRGGSVRAFRRPVFATLLGAAAALALGGCSLLYGFNPSMPPDFGMPKPVATYRIGHAAITFGKDPAIELRELSEGGTMDPSFGASATFRNSEGWYLRIMGATKGGNSFYTPAFMTLDRIVGSQHWTTFDSSRCVITVTRADETGLVGTATCKGLRWSDALSGGMGALEPPYIKGEAAFDAEITFEALPSPTQVG
jgi:hypothetical protein